MDLKMGERIIVKRKRKFGFVEKMAEVVQIYPRFIIVKFSNYTSAINLLDIKMGSVKISRCK